MDETIRSRPGFSGRGCWCWITVVSVLFVPPAAWGDRLTFQNPQEGRRTLDVNIVHESSSGDLLAESADGRQWSIRKSEILKHERSGNPVPYLSGEELERLLRTEYPTGFEVLKTKNYLLVYSTPEPFAKDAGKLLERLKSVFENYLRKQMGVEVKPLRQPMIGVIFKSHKDYVEAMRLRLGPAASATAGVYIPQDNRLYFFDMLGDRDELWFRRAERVAAKSADQIALLLATETVSTLIHEGVHQVAFNTGFHNRHVQQPVWLVEGWATLLEQPDLDAKSRWAGVGQINWNRAEDLKKCWTQEQSEWPMSLITQDEAFRTAGESQAAYAHAWGLTYFLAKTQKKEFGRFLQQVNSRPPMEPYAPEERLRDFEKAFKKPPEELVRDYRRYMEKSVFSKDRPGESVESRP